MSKLERVSAAIERGKRPVPFRTRKLSLSSSMVLQGGPCGRVDRCRTFLKKGTDLLIVVRFLFYFLALYIYKPKFALIKIIFTRRYSLIHNYLNSQFSQLTILSTHNSLNSQSHGYLNFIDLNSDRIKV
jgi:hypothetical protein